MVTFNRIFEAAFILCNQVTNAGHLIRCGGVAFPPISYPPSPEFFAHPPPPAPRIPFLVNFYFHPNIHYETRRLLEEVGKIANEKLRKILKAPKLHDTRFDRSVKAKNSREPCPPVVCYDEFVPEEFSVPCGKNTKSRKTPIDYTLSVYVMVQNESHYRDKDSCGHDADAALCRRDPDTLRPTHGRIYFCQSPKNFAHREALVSTFLHELIHVIVGDLIGLAFPWNPRWNDRYWNKATIDNLRKRSKGITWDSIQRLWQTNQGKIESIYREHTITPSVRQAVKEHFQCDSAEGAEIASELTYGTYTWNYGHWSQHLFMDELMVPMSVPGQRLSAITLGYLNDSGWFDVDMSLAEPLSISRPIGNGCDVAKKSCFEILALAVKHNQEYREGIYYTRPYCHDLLAETRCTADGRVRLICGNHTERTDNCAVLHSSYYDTHPQAYNQPECELTSQPQLAEEAGLSTGSCTTCLTVGDFLPINSLILSGYSSLCFSYECFPANNTIVFKYNPRKAGNLKCELRCHASESNKLKLKHPNGRCGNSDHDSDNSVISYVCPNYDDVCHSCQANSFLGPEMSGGIVTEIISERTFSVLFCWLAISSHI